MSVGHTYSANELTAALYNARYKAECLVFTKQLILRLFELTGIFPYNSDCIMQLAASNLGTGIKVEKAKYIDTTKKSVEQKFEKKPGISSAKQGSAKIQASKIFSPFEVAAAEYLTKV